MSLSFQTPEGDFSYHAHVRRLAHKFEQRLAQEEGDFYLDVVAVEDILEYYRTLSDWEKAHHLLTFAIGQHPYSSELYFRKASVELERHAPHAALEDLAEAIRLDPTQNAYLLLRARAYMQLLNWPAASETLQLALEHATEPAEVYYLMGRLFAEQADTQQAVKYYWHTLQVDPEVHEALYELVHALEFEERIEESRQFCEEFVDQNPFSPHGWYCFGSVLTKLGQYEKAEAAYEYACITKPDFLEAYQGRADAFFNLEKFNDALAILSDILFIDPKNYRTLLAIGECYEELLNYNQARQYYKECTHLFPEMPDAWFGLGVLLEADNRFVQAVHFYQQALSCDAHYIDAWIHLADCEYELGNRDAAFEALKQAIELDPGEIELWIDWADRFLEEGKLESAMWMIEQGLELNPLAVELTYRYAVLLFKAGSPNQAYTQLENALLLDFDKHSILYDISPQIVSLRPIQELIEQYRTR